MQNVDIKNLRKLCFFAAFVLLTVSLSGLTLATPAKVEPLGIPLIIRRPDLLPVGLLLLSIYSVVRYIYYGYLVQISPTRARRYLKRGSSVHAPTIGISLEEFTEMIANEVERYFPSFGKIEAKYTTSQTGSQCSVEMKIPKLVWILSFIEDIDYSLPVISNIVAMTCWLFFC